MNNSNPDRIRGRWAPGAEALAAAAGAISRIAAGRSAEDALAPSEASPDRSAIRAITLGTVRWYLRLAPAIQPLLQRPEQLAPELHSLLIAGAHQMVYSRNPVFSTVDAAVDAARVLKQERASGLVNAILRRFGREKDGLLASADRALDARFAHPKWLVEQLRAAWPGRLESILEANNTHPPMVLRVDTSILSVSAYLEELAAAGIAGKALPWAPAAVQLAVPVPVSSVPGFSEGRVSVQDAGAQLAAPLLECQPGMRVLDACAAPGGKTSHILELTPGLGELVAADIDARRLERVRENLERTHRSATLLAADVRNAEAIGGQFDRILVDAPCSSTGVIRRHPDIKLLRRATDIAALAVTQLAILNACFRMLAPGGRLVYATCSVLLEENEGVLATFLQAEARARAIPVPLVAAVPGAVTRAIGVQLLPDAEAGCDGFHYACVEKTTDGT